MLKEQHHTTIQHQKIHNFHSSLGDDNICLVMKLLINMIFVIGRVPKTQYEIIIKYYTLFCILLEIYCVTDVAVICEKC